MSETPAPAQSHVLRLSCANRPGIVAAVSGLLYELGYNILDSQQFDDTLSDRFFMRVEFNGGGADASEATLRARFAPLAERLAMAWTLRRSDARQKVMILVSRFDHCLADLLYRQRIGELPMEVTAVVANYPRDTYSTPDLDRVPFHFLPVEPQTKMDQEAALWDLIRTTGTELVVLARYMQVLSEGLSVRLAGRCINIHHSFLPGFTGPRPYHQAHARGVKLIGATAHYVTPQLDEGPIIEQDVERVSHRDRPSDLARKGRDIERRVLARAVRYHLEDRVILNGRTTIVFGD